MKDLHYFPKTHEQLQYVIYILPSHILHKRVGQQTRSDLNKKVPNQPRQTHMNFKMTVIQVLETSIELKSKRQRITVQGSICVQALLKYAKEEIYFTEYMTE